MSGRTEIIRVLVVDDDEDDLQLLVALLEAGAPGTFQIETASTYRAALDNLTGESEIQVVLVDHRLGPHTAIDLMAAGRKQTFSGAFVLVTGLGSSSVDDAALEAGAAAYITKQELEASALARTVRYAASAVRVADASAGGSGALQTSWSPRKGDLALQLALAKGSTAREAAAAAGVSERTVHRRMEVPGFLGEVERLRDALRNRAIEIAAQDISSP